MPLAVEERVLGNLRRLAVQETSIGGDEQTRSSEVTKGSKKEYQGGILRG